MLVVYHHAALRHDPSRRRQLSPPVRAFNHLVASGLASCILISTSNLADKFQDHERLPIGLTLADSRWGPAIVLSLLAAVCFVSAVFIVAFQLLAPSFFKGGAPQREQTVSWVVLPKVPTQTGRFTSATTIVSSPTALEAGSRTATDKIANAQLAGGLLDRASKAVAAVDVNMGVGVIEPTAVPPRPVPIKSLTLRPTSAQSIAPSSVLFKSTNLQTKPSPQVTFGTDTLRKPYRQATLGLEESLQSPAVALVPLGLRQGMDMLKLTTKRTRICHARLMPEEGRLLWDSKEKGSINMENVREVRFGRDAFGRRSHSNLSEADEARSILLIYGGVARRVQQLHLIALDDDSFKQWKAALEALHASRRALLGGLDQIKRRETAWLRQIWQAADFNADDRVDLNEAVVLCRRLGLAASLSLPWETSRSYVEEQFKVREKRQSDWHPFMPSFCSVPIRDT